MAYNPWLHRFCVLLWVSTLILVMAGATVVSKEAGLSVPDWPLSYGKVMPEMTGGVFYEHGHRMIATAVGFLTIILAVWLWRSDSRSWVKRLGFYALLGVIAQGVFGGLTVLFLLPKPVSVAHACTALLLFSLTVAIALFTSEGWLRGPEIVEDCGTPSARSLAILLPLSVLAQIALGAAYRHKAFNIIPHIAGAMVVAAIVIYTGIVLSTSFAGHRTLRKAAMHLIGLVSVQVILGIAAYVSRVVTADNPQPATWMVWLTVVHVGAGALTMSASLTTSIQILRNVRTVEIPDGKWAVSS